MRFLPDPTLLRKWLKRELAVQIVERLALCLISLFFGTIILAATVGLAFAFTEIVAIGVIETIRYCGRPEFDISPRVVWGVTSILMALLFLANHRVRRDASGFYSLRNQDVSGTGIFNRLMTLFVDPIASGDLVQDLFFSGPRLVTYSTCNLRDSIRLLRMDLDTAVDTLSILSRRFHRISLSELSKLLPGRDPMKTLFKLQEMDFVLFLSREPAGVILTLETREKLNQILGPATDFEQEPTIEEEPPEPEPVEGQQYYDLLGVEPTASLGEIKTAYRNRIKQCHPDKFVGRGEDFRKLAEERAKALNEAYDVLKGKLGANGNRG